jgi:hypothetical protein
MKSKSNEKYDIVAKLQAIQFGIGRCKKTAFLGRGIENVLALTKKLEKVQNGGLTKFIPRTVLNVYRLYSFIEQRKLADQYRFKCANDSYKYVLDRGFY